MRFVSSISRARRNTAGSIMTLMFSFLADLLLS
jgi:hypothetical protein